MQQSADQLHQTYAQIEQGLEALAAQHSLSGEPDFFELVSLAEADKTRRSLQVQEQESQAAMNRDIEELHQRFGTGVSPLDCSQLQRALDVHFLENDDRKGLEDKIDRLVLQCIFHQISLVSVLRTPRSRLLGSTPPTLHFTSFLELFTSQTAARSFA
ncbi:MAG: hypothetical protein WAU16_07585 [Rhizobiaceae bacterium]